MATKKVPALDEQTVRACTDAGLAKQVKAVASAFARLGREQARWGRVGTLLREEQVRRYEASVAATTGGVWTLESVMALDWSRASSAPRAFLADLLPTYRKRGMFPRHDGAWTDTNQVGLKIALDQCLPVEQQYGCEDFLPYVRPHKDGARRFSIFESSLSAGGIYVLAVLPNGVANVELTRYGHDSIEHSAASLRDAIAYIHRHRPYVLARSDDDDDDDDG